MASASPEVTIDPLHRLENEVHMLEDEVYPPSEVEDECLTPEVLLHSQLDQAEEFRLLLLEKCSL
jgi:hypothetical protein